jgi:hypothetical protein
MGNGDFEIVVLKVQGKQLCDVVFVFDNQDSVLPDAADVNSDLSSCQDAGAICSLADFFYLLESRPEISRKYHSAPKTN